MTRLLDQAIARLHALSAAEQDAIAALILAEIDDDKRWDAQFSASGDVLADLVRRAQMDIDAGRTRDAGFDAA